MLSRQWSQLLGGEMVRDGSRLGFSWVDSPLRVWAELDPERKPGPIALLFAGRDAELGPQPQPLLGVTVERSQR